MSSDSYLTAERMSPDPLRVLIELQLRLSAAAEQIRADRGQLEQALINPVLNARDALAHLDQTHAQRHLPRLGVRPPCGSADPAAVGERPTPPPAGWETVLVVEDDDLVRALACRGLREHGYSVLEARQGEEALALVRANPGRIALVVSDVVMPELGGRELAARLARLQPSLPVLFMSGYTGDDVVQRGLLEPGVPFQEKPLSPEGLARMVREMLDGRGTASAG